MVYEYVHIHTYIIHIERHIGGSAISSFWHSLVYDYLLGGRSEGDALHDGKLVKIMDN